MISLLSRQLGQCIVAGWIPALKGVFQAESCLGCAEAASAVWKTKSAACHAGAKLNKPASAYGTASRATG